jgi:hypothetical protein
MAKVKVDRRDGGYNWVNYLVVPQVEAIYTTKRNKGIDIFAPDIEQYGEHILWGNNVIGVALV